MKRMIGIWLSMLWIMGVAFSATIFPSSATVVYAHTHSAQATTCNNPPQPAPGSSSLLIVVLDRSGSLVAVPGGTDPDLYSASVTRALADLWPGKMAVVAFNTSNPSGNDERVQLKILGPKQVGGDQTGRDELKNEILKLPRPALGTPTGPAMDKTLEIGKNQGASLTRVVLITDGAPGYHSNDAKQNDPDGSKEEAHISDLLPQFCAASIPVDTVSLKTDARASQFLSDIATGTGGKPLHVQDPGDLANAVLGLYGQWQQNHLAFQPLQRQADNAYHVTVGPLMRSWNILVFRSSHAITIKDPEHHPLRPVENSIDDHYVYYTLSLAPPRPDGDYTIDVGGDTQAQVYTFLTSSLGVRIDTPDTAMQLVVNQHVRIQARLLNDQKPLTPLGPGAALTAYVIFTTSGQGPVTEQVDLRQQDGQNLFTGTTTSTYPQTGQLQVVVVANYGGLRAQSDVMTSILCGLSVLCIFKQHQTAFLIASPFPLLLLLALILWLIWSQQPAPFGTLRTSPAPRRRRRGEDDEDEDATVILPHVEALLPWRQRLFHRSILTSRDIQAHPDSKGGFHFGLASFDLLFKKNRVVELKSTSSMQPISVKHDEGQTELEEGQSILLKNGDVIRVGGEDCAIFSDF